MSNKEILSLVLQLPERRREQIAEAILGSIDSPSHRHIEVLWAREAESRVDALLRDQIETSPASAVLGSAADVRVEFLGSGCRQKKLARRGTGLLTRERLGQR